MLKQITKKSEMVNRIILMLVIACCIGLNAQEYKWSSLPVGGAGFVSAVITCPQQQNLIYARTDVGGAYRWNEDEKGWEPISDWVSEGSAGYLGVESFAIDPQSPNKVYMYCGTTYWNNGRSAILYSDDYGDTWTEKVNVTNFFPAHGNDYGRQAGERLAVDPNDGSVLFCGSRTRGLWKSTNGGSSWVRVASSTFVSDVKVAFVQFVADSGISGEPTPTVYVGLQRKGSTNLYVSHDNGGTWDAVAGQSTTYMTHRCLLSNGKLYITYSDSEGPGSSGSGAIRKYNLTTKTWSTISPAESSFGDITVDPEDPNKLMCVTRGIWWTQSWISGVNTYGDQIYLSENDGASWRNLFPSGCIYSEPDIEWLKKESQLHWAGSARIDPFNRNRAFITSGNGIYTTDNLWASKPTWRMALKGLEETVPSELVSVVDGPIATSIGDYDGFVYHDITKYYKRHSPNMGTTSCIAVAGLSPTKMVRSGSHLYYSSNSGANWSALNKPSVDAGSGWCTISANGGIIVWTPNGKTTYYTTNNGSTWSVLPGISATNIRFFADYEADNVFYANVNNQLRTYTYNPQTSSFSYTSKVLYNAVNRLSVVPGIAGDIWVAKGSTGLLHVSAATSATPVYTNHSLFSVTCVGVGKAAPGNSYPSVYIWGRPKTSDKTGLHRSDDKGETWMRINDNQHQFGGPGNAQFVKGDMNVYGRVYMSTVGRGIIVGEAEIETAMDVLEIDDNYDSGVSLFSTSIAVSTKYLSNYRIFNMLGAVVETGTIMGQDSVGASIPQGNYILEITNDFERISKKIVKKGSE